jgi:serine/threonine protein kinase
MNASSEKTEVAHAPQHLPAAFGKYLLTDLLAVGGMAEVYRAKIFGASDFEKEMVVKRILPRFAQNPAFVQMLIDEAKIAVSLTHGNIVPIYELGELEGSYYIAMEYVEGRTLLDVLRDAHTQRSSIRWPYCLHVVAEAARGLGYAHARKDARGQPLGLIHRDINPRNIVVTPSGEVKILDFGIARGSTKRHQTASGVIKGTPGYMSPEQMYGQSIDQRTDLYCLGILLFELLTLRRLFPVWDVVEMRQVFEAGPIPAVSSVVDVPPLLDALVLRALAPNPADRYASAQEFEEALRQAIASSGQAVTAFGLAKELRTDNALPRVKTPLPQPTLPVPIPAVPPPMPASSMMDAAMAPPLTPAALPRLDTGAKTSAGMRVPGVGGNAGAAVRTSPMLRNDEATAFELRDKQAPPMRAPAPLPMPSTSTMAMATPKTTVLARNDEIGWSRNIGADAEMLVLAKAMGVEPRANRNRMLMLAAAGVVGVVVLLALFGKSWMGVVERAIAGKQVVSGALVVKTRPGGAEVVLDGERKGISNLKLRGIDVDAPHTLVITPRGKEAITIAIVRNDFESVDGELTYTWERDFAVDAPPLPVGPSGAPPSP